MLTLTPDELLEVTGRRRPTAQARALAALGIPYRKRRPHQGESIVSEMNIQRFTVYRRNINSRGTHNPMQANPDDMPQYEGVIWTDGTVTLRWLTACRSHSVWASIADALAIHGHPEYGTVIEWHDGPAPQVWLTQVAEWQATLRSM